MPLRLVFGRLLHYARLASVSAFSQDSRRFRYCRLASCLRHAIRWRAMFTRCRAHAPNAARRITRRRRVFAVRVAIRHYCCFRLRVAFSLC